MTTQNTKILRLVVAYVCAFITMLGMALPGFLDSSEPVLNGADFFGTWDPTMIVMMPVIWGVGIPLFLWAKKRNKPVLDTVCHTPTKTLIDKKLVGGAAIFGVGWGISGFCPGQAMSAMAKPNVELYVMFAGLVVGIYGGYFMERLKARAAEASPAQAVAHSTTTP
jgi:uncharacterized protein